MNTKILKKNSALIYIITLCVLLELVFANCLYVFNMRAEIFLVLVIFLSLYFPGNISLYSCIGLGAVKDAFGINNLGFYILGFLLVRLIVLKLKRKIYPGRISIDVSLVAISSAAFYLYSVVIMNFRTFSHASQKITFSLILAVIVYTTLISVPLFLIFKQIIKYNKSK